MTAPSKPPYQGQLHAGGRRGAVIELHAWSSTLKNNIHTRILLSPRASRANSQRVEAGGVLNNTRHDGAENYSWVAHIAHAGLTRLVTARFPAVVNLQNGPNAWVTQNMSKTQGGTPSSTPAVVPTRRDPSTNRIPAPVIQTPSTMNPIRLRLPPQGHPHIVIAG